MPPTAPPMECAYRQTGKRLGSGQNDALHEGFQILNIISKMIDMRQIGFLN